MKQILLPLVLMTIVAGMLDVFVASRMSITADERLHIRYGWDILHGHPDRRYGGGSLDSQMPLSVFQALPSAIGTVLQSHGIALTLAHGLQGMAAARLATIFATLLLNLCIVFWAYDLYGPQAAIAAGVFALLSPTLMAHGTVATTDMFGALGMTAALLSFRRFLIQPTVWNTALSGLTLALAQIAKSFSVFLYAIVGMVVLCALLRIPSKLALDRKKIALFIASALASVFIVLNIAYCFDRTFTPLKNYSFESPAFQRIQTIGLVRDLPIPVPYPFLEGLDMMKRNDETGAASGNVYLLGSLGDSTNPDFHGFKLYYAVVLFFKEPIALQILFIWGLCRLWKNRSSKCLLQAEGLLLLSAAILLGWLSFLSRTQLGIRYVMAAVAVEIIIAASVFSGFSSAAPFRKGCLAALALWMAVSVGSYYPQMIPYMNEWSFDRKETFRLLADSNLDWGQDATLVEDFLRRNPDVVENPTPATTGRVLAGANRLTGVDRWNPSERFLTKYHPIAQIGYAHFLFVVPPNDWSGRSKP